MVLQQRKMGQVNLLGQVFPALLVFSQRVNLLERGLNWNPFYLIDAMAMTTVVLPPATRQLRSSIRSGTKLTYSPESDLPLWLKRI